MRLTDVTQKHLRKLLGEAERLAGPDSATARTFRHELDRRARLDGRRGSGARRRSAKLGFTANIVSVPEKRGGRAKKRDRIRGPASYAPRIPTSSGPRGISGSTPT